MDTQSIRSARRRTTIAWILVPLGFLSVIALLFGRAALIATLAVIIAIGSWVVIRFNRPPR